MKAPEWVISKCPNCRREVYNHVVANRGNFRTYCSLKCQREAARERAKERRIAENG